MTKKQIQGWVIVFFCLGLCSTAFAEIPTGSQPGINVVLVSLDSATPEKSNTADSAGWRQWEGEAPKLLASLEGEAGLVRGDDLHPTTAANLYEFRCTGRNLGDNETPAALQERLGGIFNATHRPSLLLLWQKSSAAVALTVYDGTIESLQRSLPLLQNSLGDSAGEVAPGTGILPPCVFTSKTGALQSGVSSGKLDDMVSAGNRDELLNLLAVQEFQTQQVVTKSGREQFMPAGTAIDLQTVQKSVDRFNDAVGLLDKLTDAKLPRELTLPLAMAAPVIGDLHAAGQGEYNPLTSESLERLGKLGLQELPKLTQSLEDSGRLPKGYTDQLTKQFGPLLEGLPDFTAAAASMAGRGSLQPNIAEITHALDGVSAMSAAAAGRLLGGDAGQTVAVTAADVTRDALRGMTYPVFSNLANSPVKTEIINQYRTEVAADIGHNIPIKSFEDSHPESINLFNSTERLSLNNEVKFSSDNLINLNSRNTQVAMNSTASPKTLMSPTVPTLRADTPPMPSMPDATKYYPKIPQIYGGGGGPPGGGGAFSSGGGGGGPPGGGGASAFRDATRMPELANSRFSGPSADALNHVFPLTSQIPVQMPTLRPGGILFSPDLEIVVDKTGATASRAEEAVAAIKGKAGVEFTTASGEHLIAVSQPGSAKFFQVRTGQFHFTETDLESAAENGRSLRLVRFYDSGEATVSELGQGWSYLQYSLRIGSTTRFGKDGIEVASKPILIDRERGVEIPYRMVTSDDSENAATIDEKLPSYIAIQPGIQPYLTANAEGGYTLTFAHGFQIGFDKNGRLEWMGHNEMDRVHYAFDGNNLARVFSSTAEINLKYDASSHLTGAEFTGGNSINYKMNDAGQLAGIAVGDRASRSFSYGSDDRLKTIVAIAGDGSKQAIVDNTYDNLGRMLTHKTPDEGWSIKYDDKVGSTVKTDDAGHSITHYYDGNSRIIASGESPKSMLLFNYDIYGRVIQVAEGELLNDPSGNERPRFRVTKILADLTTNPTNTAHQG